MIRFTKVCLRLAALQQRPDVIRQAFALWEFAEALKLVAFLPATGKTQREHRLRQVQKATGKMPNVDQLVAFLHQVERPKFFPKEDWDLLSIKRDRITSLFQFLKTISSDNEIDRLKAIF